MQIVVNITVAAQEKPPSFDWEHLGHWVPTGGLTMKTVMCIGRGCPYCSPVATAQEFISTLPLD